MDGDVLDQPLAHDPDPAAVVQGVAILAAGPHRSILLDIPELDAGS
jgi:hypothetical protein